MKSGCLSVRREIFFDSHKVFKVISREHCICYFVNFEDSCSARLFIMKDVDSGSSVF